MAIGITSKTMQIRSNSIPSTNFTYRVSCRRVRFEAGHRIEAERKDMEGMLVVVAATNQAIEIQSRHGSLLLVDLPSN